MPTAFPSAGTLGGSTCAQLEVCERRLLHTPACGAETAPTGKGYTVFV